MTIQKDGATMTDQKSGVNDSKTLSPAIDVAFRVVLVLVNLVVGFSLPSLIDWTKKSQRFPMAGSALALSLAILVLSLWVGIAHLTERHRETRGPLPSPFRIHIRSILGWVAIAAIWMACWRAHSMALSAVVLFAIGMIGVLVCAAKQKHGFGDLATLLGCLYAPFLWMIKQPSEFSVEQIGWIIGIPALLGVSFPLRLFEFNMGYAPRVLPIISISILWLGIWMARRSRQEYFSFLVALLLPGLIGSWVFHSMMAM